DACNHTILEDDILNYYNYPDLYKGINRANVILTVPSASAAQKAIAKYCRAYNYIRLIDLYGAVPIIDENYDMKPIRRSSEAKVMDFIVSDLLEAKANAPEFDINNTSANTMPTREAAQALLARVYRMQGKLDLAGIEAESVITSGKFSLSDNPAEKDKEVIMYLATLTSDASNAGWGYLMSWNASDWNCLAVSDEVVALLKKGDKRRALYNLEEAKECGGYVFPNQFKYANSEAWDSEFYISRLPEMYLISAEAGNANRLTELQAKRNSSLTLKEERRLELALEFVRWRDQRMEGETYLMPFPKESIAINPLLREAVIE
ncbi:MAG: RagB/SusD family nutrient uptake outer membrane protein, partial [Bacteroides sp.]